MYVNPEPWYDTTVYFLKEGNETMLTFDKTAYSVKYAKEKLKRIPLDVTKEKYEEIKQAADIAGESVNGFIKTAIDAKLAEIKSE